MKVDLPSAWTLSESQQDGTLMYCMLRSDPPTVIRSVTVSSDLHWHVHTFFGVNLSCSYTQVKEEYSFKCMSNHNPRI